MIHPRREALPAARRSRPSVPRAIRALLIALLALLYVQSPRVSAEQAAACGPGIGALADEMGSVHLLHILAGAAHEVEPVSGPPAPCARDRASNPAAAIRDDARAVRTARARLSCAAWRAPLSLRRAVLLFPFHEFW